MTFETSHSLFGEAFQGGFPWEVLEVFSGPPEVAFSWRHWSQFNGTYKRRAGDGIVYEMYGLGTATLNESGKITDLEMYYKPNEFLKAMQGDATPESLAKGASIVGSGCPYMKQLR